MNFALEASKWAELIRFRLAQFVSARVLLISAPRGRRADSELARYLTNVRPGHIGNRLFLRHR